MALLDVSKTARYGLAATWADDVFSGKMSLGSIQIVTPLVMSKVHGATMSLVQANATGMQHLAAVQQPAVRVFCQWRRVFSPMATRHRLEQYASVAGTASPINMTGVVMESGNRSNSTTSAGVNLYLDKSNFDASGITFIQDGSSATIGQGKVTTSNKQMAAGAGASVEFTFNPSANPTLSLSYTGTDSVSSAISSGTTNSSSNTQQHRSISNEQKSMPRFLGQALKIQQQSKLVGRGPGPIPMR